MELGVKSNSEYLEKFFRNLLMNEQNELKNRYLNISLEKGNVTSDVTSNVTSENIADITLRQLKIVKAMSENGSVSISQLSDMLKVAKMTIKRDIKLLKEKGYINRVGTNNDGNWDVLKNVTSDVTS